MIYLKTDEPITQKQGMKLDYHEGQRTIDPLNVRGLLAFLSQFEGGVKVTFNPVKDFEIEVIPHDRNK